MTVDGAQIAEAPVLERVVGPHDGALLPDLPEPENPDGIDSSSVAGAQFAHTGHEASDTSSAP